MRSHSIRKTSSSIFKQKSLKILTLLLPLLFLILLLPKNLFESYFPITQVKIFGVEHTNHQEIQKIILPNLKKGFFAADLAQIKEQLLQLVWVNDVSIQRIWPDKLMVSLHEKKPIARWNDMSLLTETGEIFTPALASLPFTLPILSGPTGEQLKLIRYYTQINTLFSPLHFKIARLELVPLKGWNIVLSNGLKLNVGQKDVLTRLNHFVKVYPKIVNNHENDVDYIDLRYSNGLAVRWKKVIST